MHRKIVLPILAFLIFLPLLNNSFASTSGLSHEVVSNDKMQIYVVAVKKVDMGGPGLRGDVEVVLKNIEPNARAFNPFFAKAIDSNENELKALPLLGTIQPIRIASNDILRGTLAFAVSRDADLSTLVWEEFDGSRLVIDLTKTKDPADPVPKSDWVPSSNKGKTLSDGRSQLRINDELLSTNEGYYLVDVSIRNLSDEILSYNPSFMFVKDQDGRMYPPDLQNLDLMNDPLRRGTLKQGEETRGQVLFLLPDTVSDVMLIYDESLGTGSYFATPEFPLYMMVLIASLGTGLLLSRIFANNKIRPFAS